jgi:biopolymer transport protein ExbD
MHFQSRRVGRRQLGTINVTSLVDIIFNLLLFFLLTTSFSESAGLEIELPEASSADIAIADDDLTVALLRDGTIVVRGEVVDVDQLGQLFKDHKAAHAKGAVIVQADKEVPHGRVVAVVDAAKKVGVRRLGIAAEAGR